MIKNEKQYRVAKNQMTKLKSALEASINTTVEMPKEIYEAMIAGIQSQIEELASKITEYEALSEAKRLQVTTIKDIGQLLIKARVARGYTQKELAEKIGKKTQQIQQYEAIEYKSASLERLFEIAQALDVESLDAFVSLGNEVVCEDMKYWSIDNIDTTINETKSKSKWAGYTKLNKDAFGEIKENEAA